MPQDTYDPNWTPEEAAEYQGLLAKYGKTSFSAADLDFSFEDAVRLFSLLTRSLPEQSEFAVALERGMISLDDAEY